MCDKTSYPTKQAAENAAKQYMLENEEYYGKHYKAYYCKECRKWHLSKKSPNIQLRPGKRARACDNLPRYKTESRAKQATGATRSTRYEFFYYCYICHQYHPRQD